MELFLKEFFGYDSFKKDQKEIIQSLSEGHDVFVSMNTSYGKSLCYQFGPLYKRFKDGTGTALVVSPLISLMEDQVNSLNEKFLIDKNGYLVKNNNKSTFERIMLKNCACFLGSAQNNHQVEKDAINGYYALVYLTPEKYLSFIKESFHKDLFMTSIAIDEAHCVIDWAEFRPEYDTIKRYEDVPIIALTASATPIIMGKIIKSLNLDPIIYKGSFNRHNLEYSSILKTNLKNDINIIKEICSSNDGPTIIYCQKRTTVNQIVSLLDNSSGYHAGMSLSMRKKVLDDFMNDNVKYIVATIAFGLGINKSNVRNVIHYGLPKNMESFYQETGRGGRDQNKCKCILFWSYSDIYISPDNSRKEMLNYVVSKVCRRKLINGHFDQKYEKCMNDDVPCENCNENCNKNLIKYETKDFTNDVRILIKKVNDTGSRYGLLKIVTEISDNIIIYKNKKDNLNYWKALHRLCQDNNFLVKSGTEYPIFKITKESSEFLKNNDTKLIWTFNNDILKKTSTTPFKKTSTTSEKTSEKKTSTNGYSINSEKIKSLKQLRMNLSNGAKCYQVFTDEMLNVLIEKEPKTIEELSSIKGFGPIRIEKYGKPLINFFQK